MSRQCWLTVYYASQPWDEMCFWQIDFWAILKVIYHPLYSMNKFVTNKSKLPQDGAQVFLYIEWLTL